MMLTTLQKAKQLRLISEQYHPVLSFTTVILLNHAFLLLRMAQAKKSVAKKKAASSKKKAEAEEEEPEAYPAEEQGILPEETPEEKELKMKHGEEDEDIYTDEGRKNLEEDDEIDSWEEGFTEGATAAGQLGKDALTGEPLLDIDDVVEAEIDGKTYRFVNQENAEEFRKKKEKEK
ncbi:hypothetical protein HYS49_00265, partial [Candidatus Woesearchaeota archaeon]|nr:hypothetical protein [Candidatus Woesearchaeota archaeon]